MMNIFSKACLSLALTVCVFGTAHAHAHLIESMPATSTVVTTAPDTLKLRFSEGVQLSFTGVILHGPNGQAITTGRAKLAPKNDMELLIPLPHDLPRGRYFVQWHALSDDGHTTQGSYGFSIAD